VAYCWEHRLSRSNPRVLNTLERAGGFASAQEIYRLMQREGESIGLTTVYRSLQSLASEKIVDILRRDDGEAIFRLCGGAHHHHLICKGCGNTVEIEGGAVEKWAKVIAEEYGFRDVGHTAEIFGLCEKC